MKTLVQTHEQWLYFQRIETFRTGSASSITQDYFCLQSLYLGRIIFWCGVPLPWKMILVRSRGAMTVLATAPAKAPHSRESRAVNLGLKSCLDKQTRVLYSRGHFVPLHWYNLITNQQWSIFSHFENNKISSLTLLLQIHDLQTYNTRIFHVYLQKHSFVYLSGNLLQLDPQNPSRGFLKTELLWKKNKKHTR